MRKELDKIAGDVAFHVDKQGNYDILKNRGICKCLRNLYTLLVYFKEILPLEDLPEDEKLKWWNIGKQFHTETSDRILASSSAYVLDFIKEK